MPSTPAPDAAAVRPAAMTAVPAIEAADATHRYPGGDGVAGLDLDIPTGSHLWVHRAVGCGQDRPVRLLAGALRPEQGGVRVLGGDPVRFGSRQRRRLGYMPQLSVLYPELSVEENLRFFASIYGMGRGRRPRIDRMLDLVELTDHRGKQAKALSGGMRRRLSLAASLVHDPEVLFLDEPTAGVDPMLRVALWDLFRDLAEQGRTAFVATQYVGEAAYCDKVGLLADGGLVAVDTPEGLRRTAFGGDLFDVELAAVPAADVVAAMGSVTGVRRARAAGRRRRCGWWWTTPPGGSPRCSPGAPTASWRWIGRPGRAPFDDVFVDLVERHQGKADSCSARSSGRSPSSARKWWR